MTKRFYTGANFYNNSISGVVAASLDTDVPNWGQVKSFVNGLTFKQAVRAASLANVTVSAPGASIDGVSLAAGDRVLLKNQTTASENGLYLWNGASAAMTRTADGITNELTSTSTVYVQEGSQADKQFTLTTFNPITVGTTSQTWAQSGGGTTYSNGTYLTLTSGVFDVDTTKIARKYAANIGDGTTTAIVVTHNLGTRDVAIQLYDAATYETVECDVVRTSTNTATLTFSTAPASNAFRVVISG